MSIYELVIPQLKKTLLCLDQWIEKGVAHAKEKSFEPDVLLNARLAPDQYPFVRQVQAACDAAKFAAARTSGTEPPKHPDTETTVEELRARIKAAVAFVDSVKPSAYATADSRMVPLQFIPGQGLAAQDFLVELSIPNFYFHATTAYAILRHNGVPLGKADFIGSLNLKAV